MGIMKRYALLKVLLLGEEHINDYVLGKTLYATQVSIPKIIFLTEKLGLKVILFLSRSLQNMIFVIIWGYFICILNSCLNYHDFGCLLVGNMQDYAQIDDSFSPLLDFDHDSVAYDEFGAYL